MSSKKDGKKIEELFKPALFNKYGELKLDAPECEKCKMLGENAPCDECFNRIAVPLPSQEVEPGKIHELKTWSEYFVMVFMGRKTFEVRKNDRGFKIGDTLILQEGDLNGKEWIATGRTLARKVTSIVHGGQFGVKEGYCVMSIA